MDAAASLPASHILHPGYSHKVLQSWSSEHANVVPKAALVWPLFLLEDVSKRETRKRESRVERRMNSRAESGRGVARASLWARAVRGSLPLDPSPIPPLPYSLPT